MSFFLHQALPIFALPAGFSVAIMLAGLLTGRRAWIWLGIGILYASSIGVVSGPIMRATEGWNAQRVAGARAPTADAIVVLSTGRVVPRGPDNISEWGDADRFFGGVELFQAGKAPLLVFTGGWAPWAPTAPLEGNVLTKYAEALGVPASAIVATGAVVNTAEEAAAVAEILHHRIAGRPHILLVTSAYHVPRAQRLFERAGFVVTPFLVDFFSQGTTTGPSVMDFLPTSGSLDQTDTAVRELYGRLFYRVFPPAPVLPSP